jgi:hypothetical protein
VANGFKKLEQEIARLRIELGDLSRKRYSAETSGNKAKIFDARIKLADPALTNCSIVTDYIRKVSETTANEVDLENRMVAQSLRKIKVTRNLDALHSWYRKELAPFWNKVEQEWHIIAEMREEEKARPQRRVAVESRMPKSK